MPDYLREMESLGKYESAVHGRIYESVVIRVHGRGPVPADGTFQEQIIFVAHVGRTDKGVLCKICL
jgi:hypothetical protein